MMGGIEIVFFLFVLGGESDFVSALDPADYFKAREINPTTMKLTELATTPPTSGKAQIQQLLALRMIAEKAKDIRQADNFQAVYKAVESVANGQKAQDLQGFAKSYATKAYRALGAKIKVEPRNRPVESVRKEAFKWFPKGATLVGSVDTRGITNENQSSQDFLNNHFLKSMPQQGKNLFYEQIEKLGNVRVDRYSFAWVEDPQGGGSGKIFMRVTGKANHDWILAVFEQQRQFELVKSQRRFRGRKISLLSARFGPSMGFVGDSDWIMAGYERGQNGIDVVKEALQIRSSKLPNVLAGPLGKKLATVSPKTGALLTGTLPLGAQRELNQGTPLQIRDFPKQFMVEVTDEKKNYTVKATGQFGTEEAAKNFVNDANTALQFATTALQLVKNNPPPFPAPVPNWGKLVDGGVAALKTIKLTPKGSSVNGTGQAPKALVTNVTKFAGAMTGLSYRVERDFRKERKIEELKER
ncbi:MAG: hypothetical protein ACFCD0_08145 [Gemmataceae bacterium]